MKKLAILMAILVAPMLMSAQNVFDSFEDERDVSSVVVTKNMFKLLSKLDLESNDPEAKEYLELVNNLDNIKIYTTENEEVASRMDAAVATYLSKSSGLSELMRVKDDGKNIKFYSKEGKNENFVSELLMHLTGNIEGDDRTIIMSITGNIDLKKISKLTSDLNMPGSEELKNIDKKN
jgi:ATP phosphoribosyltransferase